MGATDLHASISATLHHRYPFLGMVRAHHTNKRAQPMSFADKPYLIPLYLAMPHLRDAVFCKAVQTGLSELLIAYMFHQAGWNDRICAYVLPQYKTSERFVADRVDPVILRTPAYAERMPGGLYGMEEATGRGNLKRKRFGRRGSLLFLGSNTPSDFLEFSADTVIVDEYDACDMRNVAKVRDRVRESEHPQVIRVSNPRVAGKGITRAWKDGTRARWFHRCDRCGERQYLDWFRHFVYRDDMGSYWPRDRERSDNPALGDLRPVCQRCEKPWDRRAAGSLWVAEEPGRERETFHISRLDVLSSRRDPQPMRAGYREFVLAQSDTALLEAWWAGFLGWVWEREGTAITQGILDAASEGQPPMDHHGGDQWEDRTVVMGVDVGSVLNVKVSWVDTTDDERHPYIRRPLWVGAVPEFDDLMRIRDRYHADVMVIDAMPETRKAKEIRDHYAYEGTCQVWLARYHNTPRVGTDAFGMRQDYEERVVTVDRTQLLDTTLDDLKHKRCLLPGDVDTVLHFASQMKAPKRRTDGNRVTWDEGSDPDHYRHADAYERIALEIHARSGGYFE